MYWFVTCTLKEQCSHAFPLTYRILILLFVFLLIGIIIWIIFANMHRLELTIKILQVAATALARNLWLVAVIVLLTLGLVLYFVPIVVFLVFAQRNGQVLPKDNDGEYYCAWKQDSWVPAYFALGILTMLWSLASMLEAQVYVISGTVAQWYFTPEGENSRGCITTSLRHAFGPSVGTVCFSGLIMFIVRIVRSIVDRQHSSSGIVNLIIKWFADFVFSSIDFVNKFTINFAAITGEAYCSSARMTYELLKRNLLSAVFVETVSTRIMAGIVFVVSTAYAIVVFIILKFGSDLGIDSYFVALAAWLVLITVLGFFVRILDNVIDTVYVCYAIDRDKREVSKPEVHEIYVLLPISRTDRPSLATRTPMDV